MDLNCKAKGSDLIRTKINGLLGHPSQLFGEWGIILLSLLWLLAPNVLGDTITKL